MVLEPFQQAVAVSLVPFLLPHRNALQVGDAAAQGIAQAPDPDSHLVTEDEIVVFEVGWLAGDFIFTHGEVVKPVGELLALFRFALPAPCLGEHSIQVLQEILGYDDDDLARIAASGALR